MVTDDGFKDFVKKMSEEEAKKALGNKGSVQFDVLKWTGLPKKGSKIIRALGGAPDTNLDEFTGRTVHLSRIKGDNGKETKIHLPINDETHIMWRIIGKVLSVDWVDKKKVFVYEKARPEIFDMVRYNRLPANSPQRQFTKGWSGQNVFVMNCLDRDPEVYNWSKENKHSVLLSKNISVTTDPATGRVMEFVDEGVPSYGFLNILASNIIKYYGDWNFYDLKIERTGITTSPYTIVNASKHIEEVDENLRPYVVEGPLSEEELSWERYDLRKYFGVSSYTKIHNRLSKSIAAIDFALGTHYSEELKSLVEQEEKERKEEKGHSVVVTNDSPILEEPTLMSEAPTPEPQLTYRERKVSAKTGLDFPKGYSRLTSEEQKQIVGMKLISGDTWDILYEGTTAPIVACTVCKTPSPENFAVCPGCGNDF